MAQPRATVAICATPSMQNVISMYPSNGTPAIPITLPPTYPELAATLKSYAFLK